MFSNYKTINLGDNKRKMSEKSIYLEIQQHTSK